MRRRILGGHFRCTGTFWQAFSMYWRISGGHFRCTGGFLAACSMHLRISGGPFRCAGIFLAGIFDVLEDFWQAFSMYWMISGRHFRCTGGFPAGIFDVSVGNQCIENGAPASPWPSHKHYELQNSALILIWKSRSKINVLVGNQCIDSGGGGGGGVGSTRGSLGMMPVSNRVYEILGFQCAGCQPVH